jgi:hypothetical protein
LSNTSAHVFGEISLKSLKTLCFEKDFELSQMLNKTYCLFESARLELEEHLKMKLSAVLGF